MWGQGRNEEAGRSLNITLETGKVAFTISRGSTPGSTPWDVTGCRSAFAEIALECFSNRNVAGGEVESRDGIVYKAVYSNIKFDGIHDEHSRGGGLVSRSKKEAPKGLLSKNVKPKPKSKTTKQKSKQKSKSKPKSEPKSKSKSKPKPKPKSKQNPKQMKLKPTPGKDARIKPTPTSKTRPTGKETPSKGKKTPKSTEAGPTKKCDQIYDLLLKESLAIEGSISQAPRDGFIERREWLEKRAPKSGTACPNSNKVVLKALDYPAKNQMVSLHHFSSRLYRILLSFLYQRIPTYLANYSVNM